MSKSQFRQGTKVELNAVYMNDFWDKKLLPNYDRNYSSNAIEVILEDGTPFFQIIYERANIITVNGILYEGIKTQQPTPYMISFKGEELFYFEGKNQSEIDSELNHIRQKFLFKYPSWKYPGVLAK